MCGEQHDAKARSTHRRNLGLSGSRNTAAPSETPGAAVQMVDHLWFMSTDSRPTGWNAPGHHLAARLVAEPASTVELPA